MTGHDNNNVRRWAVTSLREGKLLAELKKALAIQRWGHIRCIGTGLGDIELRPSGCPGKWITWGPQWKQETI